MSDTPSFQNLAVNRWMFHGRPRHISLIYICTSSMLSSCLPKLILGDTVPKPQG